MATGKSTARNCKCELSREDKMAIIALRIDPQDDDFIEKMVDLELSAGMVALFEKVIKFCDLKDIDHTALAMLTAAVLEAAKQCGIA
jgi:hypothetical protein